MVLEEAEEVFLWFSTLSTARRIDVMYGLLNKCLPFEWRFLGSCIEDLFKQYFSYFRDTEFRANSAPELAKLSDLSDSSARHRLIVSIAFLCSSNRTCSNIIFSSLTSEANVQLVSRVNSKTALDEFLLLFTLAARHPAFTFDQKQALEWRIKELSIKAELLEVQADQDLKAALQAECPGLDDQPAEPEVGCAEGLHYANGVLTTQCTACGTINVAQYVYPAISPTVPYTWPCAPPSASPPLPPPQPPTVLPQPTASVVAPTVAQVTRSPCAARPTVLPLPTPRAHVKHLELKSAPRKKKPDKRTDFRIQVTWSNGESTEVSKTLQELCDFHQQLTKTVRTPYFAGPPKQSLRGDESAEDGTGRINEYLRQLTGKVPLDSELVVGFFRPSPESATVAQTNNAGSTVSSDDRNACSSPSAALPIHSNPTSPPPTIQSKYSVASPVHAFHCATVGINDINHQLGSLTIYNSCHASECSTKTPVTANNNQQSCVRVVPSSEASTVNVCSKHSVGTGAKLGLQSQNECNDDLARLERVFESEKLSKLWEVLRRKHLPTKQILNLTEDDLKNDGFSTDKAEKILKLFRTYKQKLPNGFYPHTDVDHVQKSYQISQHCSPPPAVQTSCCTVQAVQTQVYMPDAPIDLLTSHCLDPMMTSHSTNNRHQPRNSPDSSRSCIVSSTKAACNGEADEVFVGEHRESSDGYARHKNKTADLNVKENDLPRDYRPRRNSRGNSGIVHPKMKSTSRSNDSGSRKSSLTSVDVRQSQSPGCDDADSCDAKPGELRPHPHSHSNIPYAARNGSSPLSISEDPAAAPPNNPGILPGMPSYSTAPSGAYPATVPQPHSHMPRLPSRPIATMGMCTTCPCSRPSATPPPLPSPHPIAYPQIMPFFPAFPPNHMAAQSTYLSPHTTNGFVTTPPGVPPTRTFQFLHSPDGITAHEVTFPHQFSNMLQVQQPPPHAGLTASQRMQPPPPPVPGFVAGPTPNVGFHGHPMHPPNLTSLPPPPGAPGMAPPHSPYVAPKTATCFNCGHSGHHGSECMEKTMDDISKGGQFQLSFNRGEKAPSDGCE